MASCTEATTSLSPRRSAHSSRNSRIESKLSPVSTCMTGNGMRAGANALRAMCSMTMESLPPENSRQGFCISAATSRKMWMLSASRLRSWLSTCWVMRRDLLLSTAPVR